MLTLFVKVTLPHKGKIEDRQIYLIVLMDGTPHHNLLDLT